MTAAVGAAALRASRLVLAIWLIPFLRLMFLTMTAIVAAAVTVATVAAAAAAGALTAATMVPMTLCVAIERVSSEPFPVAGAPTVC
jgi:hypothetical protein